MEILIKIQRGSILIIYMGIPGFKRLTLFDILCTYYGFVLGFYVGICNQCNYGYLKQQGVRQYIEEDNIKVMRQTSNSIVQAIK